LNILFVSLAGSGIRVNARPFFLTKLEDFRIELESKDQENVFLFPEIGDEDPSLVVLNVTEGFKSSFMNMTLGGRGIKFDRFSKENQGNHSMKLNLTDFEGNFREYNWTVTIVDYMEEEQIQSWIENNTETVDNKFKIKDLVSKKEEQDEQDSIERETIEIRVKEFNENGELTLIFSEELFPIEHYKKFGLNLTTLNQKISNILQLDYKFKKYINPD